MKKCLAIALGLLSTSVMADPQFCPDISSIKAVGVSTTVIQVDNVWVSGRRNQLYNTADHWTFLLGNIIAPTANDAYHIAVNALSTLRFQVGPIKQVGGKFVCVYSTAPGYPAVTVTTPIALQQGYGYLRT